MGKRYLQPAEAMDFLRLVKKYIISIPVIQRDYAQGRQTEDITKIREDFVHDLLYDIMHNDVPHQIDFVYGTVEHKSNSEDIFIPLDGQQRLTTLFLLYEYIAGISGHYDYFAKMIRGRFEYATRKSSTEFCRGLIAHNVCSELMTVREKDPNAKLSLVIENQGWFFSAWKQDPTVQGMLIMLDEIDRQATATKVSPADLFSRLFDEEHQAPIVFQWQPLEGYTLTDDLYIKMNARGLKLTDFEVFKALYEMSLTCVDDGYRESFVKNIDGNWCDYLWKKKDVAKSTDDIMERILRLMIAFGFARKDVKDNDLQVKLDKLFSRNKHNIQFSYSRYRELGVFHDTHQKPDKVSSLLKQQECLIAQCVVEAFDTICDDSKIRLLNEPDCSFWCDGSKLIRRILQSTMGDLTYEDLLFFYAFVSFVARYQGDVSAELASWMRYMHNLINATIINDSVQLARSIRSIDAIVERIGNQTVLRWVADNASIAAFSSNQSYEESVKARLLLWGADELHLEPRWREQIEINEKDTYMRGQIGFLLVSAGMYDTDIQQLSKDDSDRALDVMMACSTKARNIFIHFRTEDKMTTEHLLERALLTKGMYLKNASAWRLNFCNRPFDRDYSWRKMLEITPGEQLTQGVTSMISLLKDEWQNDNDAISSLEHIIRIYLDGPCEKSLWYHPFLDDTGLHLIDLCHQGFLHKYEDVITLLHESQMNHYHSELQSRLLYLELIQDYPFIHYCAVRSSEEIPGVYFHINIEDKILTIFISHTNKWLLEVYDEHMYNNMFDGPDWFNYQEQLSEILQAKLDNKVIVIDKSFIYDLLERLTQVDKVVKD